MNLNLVHIVLVSAVVLWIAYRVYGSVLARLLQLDPERATPAVELRDDVDYVPIEPKFLLSQHFSAIAAAGPIVGPILAGLAFGWLPALLWILIGGIFIGGVHDMTALAASIRHKARSIAEVVRDHMSRRSYLLFLVFVWLALVYIVVAFTDVTSASFIGTRKLSDDTVVSGAGIATSSLLYLALPVMMGLLLRYTRMSLNVATVVFLPLVGLAIWLGQKMPLDLAGWLGLTDAQTQGTWNVALLSYCIVASLVPMWLLLQPRGHLGGYFLLVALLGGGLGLVFGGFTIEYPRFTGFESATGEGLFPFLFITIACGACSGFHAIIASGTTSKQLRRETDARLIGYGAMLMESMVAIVSLCCVMMLRPDSDLVKKPEPNLLYAHGLGQFLSVLGIPVSFAVCFGFMAFTTFVYDTLDVCTRLGRYILQELTGWHGRAGKVFATVITGGTPLFLLVLQQWQAKPGAPPAWKVFWLLFGASNQLLAALTLLGVTVWLWQTRRARWVWLVTGLPTVGMYAVSMWALIETIYVHWVRDKTYSNPVPWVAAVLVALAALMLVEAIKVLAAAPGGPARGQLEAAPA